MNVDQLSMFVHVAAAMVWVGTSLLQVVLGVRVVRAGDLDRTVAFARDGHWAGLHLYAPANLLLLASGLLLAREDGVGFGSLWIDVGLAGWTLSVVLGAVLLKPGWAAATRIGERLDEREALQAAVRRLVLLTCVDLAVLTGVVYAMTAKPTGHQPAALVIGGAVVAGVLLVAAKLLRGWQAPGPEAVAHHRPPARRDDTVGAKRVGSR